MFPPLCKTRSFLELLILSKTTTLVQAPSTQVITITEAPSTYTYFRTQTINVPITEVCAV
jgi:hypothetical protein